MKKRLRIISLIKKTNSHYLKKKHKVMVEVPRSVAQAYALDENNGNTLWADGISKEIKDVSPDFRKLDNGEIFPIGYQRVNCHMIFDVEMEEFRKKARLVVVGHVTDPPATITYGSVVSMETLMIALDLDDLNDLSVKVAEIQNAYITAPVTEMIWIFLGREFAEDAGKKSIVVFALYGCKSV